MNTYKNVIDKSPQELFKWLTDNFLVELPSVLMSIEDMEYASSLLMQLAGYYQYLTALLSYAKISTRAAKRNLSKEAYENMVDKKELIQNTVDAVKQSYNAVSRAVTIHIENNAELRMNSSGSIRE